jgi:hypothetical protein
MLFKNKELKTNELQKKLSETELEAKKLERDARRKLFRDFSKMSEEQKKEIMDKVVLLTTCEGHALTLNNTLFVHEQIKQSGLELTPTIIGGFHQWTAQNRVVKKGSKALYILVPCGSGVNKDKTDDEKGEIYFIERPVFDISSTITFEEAEALKKQA